MVLAQNLQQSCMQSIHSPCIHHSFVASTNKHAVGKFRQANQLCTFMSLATQLMRPPKMSANAEGISSGVRR